MHGDDGSIAGDDTLYRRIARHGDTSMMVIDEASGEVSISSGAFKMDADGCSVYLQSVLTEHSMGPAELVNSPQNVVIAITADQVRDERLGVRRDPRPFEEDGYRGEAHALIVNPADLGRKALRRAFRVLAHGATIVVTPS